MFYEFESQSLFLTNIEDGGESNRISVTAMDWLIPLNCHFLIIASVDIQKHVKKQQSNVKFLRNSLYRVNHNYLLFEIEQVEV